MDVGSKETYKFFIQISVLSLSFQACTRPPFPFGTCFAPGIATKFRKGVVKMLALRVHIT